MIQELFGGGNSSGLVGERKISIIPYSSSSSTTCHASSSPLLVTTTSSTNLVNSPSNNVVNNGGGNNNSSSNNMENNNNNGGQNLRCPRCDSTNTKFCYYNNYNLTQPRHFCKTCRRYWTKGGTLRNVPIGGGCRKNKSSIISNNSSPNMLSKSSTNVMAKAKATLSSELFANDNNSLFLGNGLLDHHPLQPASPWASQNSHILALLRESPPFSNPNPNPNSTSSVFTNLGLDSYINNNPNGAPSLLGSFTRSNPHNLNGFSPDLGHHNSSAGTNTTSNILDLYQRLKSSSNYSYNCGNNENQGGVNLGQMMGSSSSSMSSSALDATPLGGSSVGNLDGYGFMSSSPAISNWSDFPAVSINASFS